MRTSFSTVCVQSCEFFVFTIANIPCPAWLELPGIPLRFAVLKIEAEEFFPLKSRSLSQHKTLPHNFVHRKCEETHSGMESVCREADETSVRRTTWHRAGRMETGCLAQADWALHRFSGITLELAQKAGGIINTL